VEKLQQLQVKGRNLEEDTILLEKGGKSQICSGFVYLLGKE